MPEDQLRVVLGADPLLQPFTGIANYTRSLASNLLELQLVDGLSLYCNGVVLPSSKLSFLINSQFNSARKASTQRGRANITRLLTSLRGHLASHGWAVKAYQSLMPLIDRARLYPHRGSVFHAPNYLLPPFDGPTVVTFHDLSIQRFPDFHPKARVLLLEKHMEATAARASHIITDSALVRREVIDYYDVDPNRVTAIPLAAEDRFRPRSAEECSSVIAKFGLEYRGFMLFSGTVEPRKNILRICAAYKDLRSSGRLDLPLIFVGAKGWGSDSEHHEIEYLVANGWAQYLGYVDDHVLATLYSAARGLIFPSIYEGFGLPALEAQQSKTPVLTSKGSTMAEFASDRDILVDPADTEAIREGIALLASCQHWHSNGDTMSRHSADTLSWTNTARKTAAVYQRIRDL